MIKRLHIVFPFFMNGLLLYILSEYISIISIEILKKVSCNPCNNPLSFYYSAFALSCS